MRVELTGARRAGELRRIEGRVEWEGVDRPTQDVFIATERDRDLAANADWLLMSAFMAAQREHEPRLRVDGPVSPVLVGHLRGAQGLLRTWHGEPPVPIEAPSLYGSVGNGRRATGLFLSGGVDSLASMLSYRSTVPPDHPDAVRYGANIDMSVEDDPTELRPKHRTALETIAPAAMEAGVRLVPLVTNLRRLGPLRGDTTDWMERAHGAFYAAIAHAMSPMTSRMLLASSFDYPNVVPWGSHPMLDPLLGSGEVMVDHHNAHLSRYQKVLTILELGGPDAVASLIVCFGAQGRAPGAPPNCGRCEKCVRTLIELTAAGVDVEGLATFEERTVSASTIRSIGRFADSYQFDCWRDLIGPLRAAGRVDLSRAVAAKVRSNTAFEFDRARLGGTVWRTKRAVRHPSKAFRGMRRRLTHGAAVQVGAGSGVADG